MKDSLNWQRLTLVPKDSRVSVRPMFGNVSAFVNGNMFAGLYGTGIFVRLSEADRRELLKVEGASLFEPMKGRPMKEYVMVPVAWRREPEKIREWADRSLRWASKLPTKGK